MILANMRMEHDAAKKRKVAKEKKIGFSVEAVGLAIIVRTFKQIRT